MAWHYYDQGRKAEAEFELKAAVQNSLKGSSHKLLYYAYGELGMFYVQEEYWKGAKEVLSEAVILQPEAFQYHFWLGIAYKNIGDINHANLSCSWL